MILFLRRDASGDAIPSVIAGNLPAAALAFPFALGHLALDGRGVLLILFLGIVQLGVSYVLFLRGLEVVPAAEASLLGMLEPMFNPLWAFLGLGEKPSAWASSEVRSSSRPSRAGRFSPGGPAIPPTLPSPD